MDYKRLPFEQYFIDAMSHFSNDEIKSKKRFAIAYNDIAFKKRFIKYHANYCVHYDAPRDVIQIYFEDSVGFSDWVTNFMFTTKMYDSFTHNGKKIKLISPKGFRQQWFQMKKLVRADFKQTQSQHPDSPVEIIGWSQGSVYAQFCAQDLNFNFGVKAHVFTFGSVKPFKKIIGQKTVRDYLLSCCAEVYNFADINDIVGYCVPLPGFFKIRPLTVQRKKFELLNFFNVLDHHCGYFDSSYYKNF